ncbi:MAG: LysR family transcriptional regulator [Beutenbergiaceae bacterium]
MEGPIPASKLTGLTLERLLSFIAVIESGGFGKAAEAIHKSQSRVSVHVSDLERLLGSRLIDRGSRPVAPTDTGQALYDHVKKALAELELGLGHVEALRNLDDGQVRIGSYASVSASFLPEVMNQFMRRFPKLQLSLYETGPLEVEEALRNRAVSMAIRTAYPPLGQGMQSRTLWREPILLALPTGHRLLAAGPPPIRDVIADQRVISVGLSPDKHPHGARELDTVLALEALGVDVSRVIFTSEPQALISMVRAGIGVGIANSLAIASGEARGVSTFEIDHPQAIREVVLCWYTGHYHSIAERAFFRQIVSAPHPHGTLAPPPHQGGAVLRGEPVRTAESARA